MKMREAQASLNGNAKSASFFNQVTVSTTCKLSLSSLVPFSVTFGTNNSIELPEIVASSSLVE